MALRTLIAGFGLVLLAACGKQGGAGNGAAAAAPVAAVTPPAGQKWTDVVAMTPEGGFRMGNPDAPIKVVEYGARTCPTCGNFGRTGMQPLENQYVTTGKVSYEFRDYIVHGVPDVAASLVGRCVPVANLFPVLEQMYINQGDVEQKMIAAPADFQQKIQAMSPTGAATAWAEYLGYIDFMKQRGLPEPAARACLNDKAKLDALVAMTNKAVSDKNVTGTPTFFINDQKQPPEVLDWASLEAALKAAGA